MKFSTDFGEFLYNRLPSTYRSEDKHNNLTLKNFINVLNSGGFQTIIDKLNNLEDLLDIDKVPLEYLPYLGRLYGYDYTEDLPEWFQRRLLKNIVELYRRKGTKSAINFIAREMSGFETEIIEMQDRFIRTWSANTHPELAEYIPNSGTFDALTTDLNYLGYGDKYSYKNFYLILKAPYEMNLLTEKEEVVAKVIEQFKPSHSKVYIVTVYWFLDEKKFMYDTLESIVSETMKYTEVDVYTNSDTESELVKMKLNDILDETIVNNSESPYTLSTLNFQKLNSSLYLSSYMDKENIKIKEQEEVKDLNTTEQNSEVIVLEDFKDFRYANMLNTTSSLLNNYITKLYEGGDVAELVRDALETDTEAIPYIKHSAEDTFENDIEEVDTHSAKLLEITDVQTSNYIEQEEPIKLITPCAFDRNSSLNVGKMNSMNLENGFDDYSNKMEESNEISGFIVSDSDIIGFSNGDYDEALLNRHELNSRLILNCKNGYDIIHIDSTVTII